MKEVVTCCGSMFDFGSVIIAIYENATCSKHSLDKEIKEGSNASLSLDIFRPGC